MKTRPLSPTPDLFASTRYSSRGGTSRNCFTTGLAAAILLVAAVLPAQAQTVRFRAGLVRVTVPLNSTNSTVITNLVNVDTNITGPVNFDVSGLPAGAGAVLTDTNGNSLLSTTIDTNLWLTINTTNIAEGLYTFSLNGSGGATNSVRFILQAAHIWTGSNGVPGISNAWSVGSSWLGGAPGPGSDVIFNDTGAQTNIFANGNSFTNSFVDANTTIGSLRFAQTGMTNSIGTNDAAPPRFHGLRINPGVTLSITGTNGFGIMRDYVDDIQGLGTMTVQISGGAGSRLVVSNAAADFGILIGNTARPTLTMSNLENGFFYVRKLGLAEYQLFPNYRNYNDDNNFGDNPRRMIANIHLPRTNVVTALYKDPDNYNNEFTRAYALSYQNSEVSGVGSGTDIQFFLGQSNAFFLDSVCLIRANHATGNNGSVRFNPVFPTPTALFRSTNGGRMSVFTVSDDGGTNYAASNVKATIDFATGNGTLDMLVDRLYISRDRTLIASNQTPNVQGDLTIGRGVLDANSAILGYQEHDGKTNWTLTGGAPYLNYCQGRLFVTNGGTVRVRGNLTLGYTADTNPEGAAQQYNTFGQITIFSNSMVTASNVVVDGGSNFTSTQNRQNRITVNQGGILAVTNTIGDAPGLKLDTLTLSAGTNVLFVDVARTNVIVKTLLTPGSVPSTLKVASLTGVTSYPVQVPVISYETASPFLVADVSALGAGYSGYVLDNQANKTVDIFITTNPPNTLVWRGTFSPDWDTTTKNWVTVGGGIQTNFNLGDIVTFDDSSSVNNVNVVGSVVPGQAGTGVTVTNVTRAYTFSGGTIAGTSLLVKSGTNSLTIDATKQGPVIVSAGTLAGAGLVGGTTVASNATLNFAGFVNGGLTSTGNVQIASSCTVFGPVALRGGTLVNSGVISNTPNAMAISGTVLITNQLSGTMNILGGNYSLPTNCVLANFGIVNNLAGRINLDGGLVFGTGSFLDPDSGLVTGVDGRFAINIGGVLSPGDSPSNSIGTITIGARVDLNNTANSGLGVLVTEVDFSNPQTNDIVLADKWNNLTGLLLMTNINPGAGLFGLGQAFQVFRNTSFGFPNSIDVNGSYPMIWPPLPAPGLQWGTADFRTYGLLTITNSALVWNGNVDGNWDTNTANWKSSLVYADNQGALLDDSAIGTTTITLTNVVAPCGFILTTNIVPNVSTNIFTNNPVMAPGIVVSNSIKDYVISGPGRLSGMTGLYKTGTGTLTLLTSNDFTGNTTIAGGTLAISNLVAAIGINGAGGLVNDLFIDGGTLKYIGISNVSLPRPVVIQPNSATFDVASATNELTGSTMYGPGSLTKIGPGTLILGAAANNFAGGTIVNAGILRLTAAGAGYGILTLANSSTLQVTNGITFTNVVNVTGSGVTIRNLAASTNVSSGAWTGTGGVTFSNANQFIFNGSLAAFGGTISFGTSAGTFRFNNASNANNCRGSAAATFDLGTGSASLSNHNGGNLTYDLGALLGGASTLLAGRASNTTAWVAGTTYSIGANGSNSVFNGRIMNGLDTVSVTKVGTGLLALNGINLYTGPTTVSGGTLGGTGAISGPVTVGVLGTLAPGLSIGTLAISNSLSLSGTTVVEVSRNGATLSSDKVIGLTNVSFGGTLVVSNLGPSTLLIGDSFQLFNIGGSGSFSSIVPTLTSGRAWSFNPATGVLTLIANPPVLHYGLSGNNVGLSWTEAGFKLQAQTNGLDVGISTNWGDYPGGGSSPVNVPINALNGSVFFRLISTP